MAVSIILGGWGEGKGSLGSVFFQTHCMLGKFFCFCFCHEALNVMVYLMVDPVSCKIKMKSNFNLLISYYICTLLDLLHVISMFFTCSKCLTSGARRAQGSS